MTYKKTIPSDIKCPFCGEFFTTKGIRKGQRNIIMFCKICHTELKAPALVLVAYLWEKQ